MTFIYFIIVIQMDHNKFQSNCLIQKPKLVNKFLANRKSCSDWFLIGIQCANNKQALNTRLIIDKTTILHSSRWPLNVTVILPNETNQLNPRKHSHTLALTKLLTNYSRQTYLNLISTTACSNQPLTFRLILKNNHKINWTWSKLILLIFWHIMPSKCNE